jgi:hypothetical protein
MADFEGILARHSQSPYVRGQTFLLHAIYGMQLSYSSKFRVVFGER